MKLTIGKLADAAGVHVETIRFYERKGLIIQPLKPVEGFRQYPSESLQRIHFIKRAQDLWFTLDEISSLLKLGDSDCLEAQALAQQKLVLIRKKIADLQRLERKLSNLITQCSSIPNSSCPIVDSFKE
ncbi:Hg(II)-responsive transcriptional regulator [Enterovibrio nigricans]|uniref:Mercuric resistance operon regulatory protein n=1 Tax=Enterovibrio nigricans DSM 22720 TaxID=1121868 RepID=A0A1T4VDF3_9GAMM|nr:Hg(II)-responsive transcriptional regulator [Enterovibrio nigricans]PKF49940.1 Hg(II)-responsive transcriptional regulator [Enterovibrio nigricans]SKA62591.1 MerR family transcriptional regulator, mercuric resistance operon regulatory protein [Enterovibrio nigricans DSM 22720]